MAEQPETKIQQITVKALNQIEGCRAEKIHGSMYGFQKLDIFGAVDSMMFYLEAKQPGNKPTPRQNSTMKKWSETGILVTWFDDPNEAVRMVSELKKTKDPDKVRLQYI